MRKIKADLIVIGILIGIAFLLWLYSGIQGKGQSDRVFVSQNGDPAGTYSLKENRTVYIPYEGGGYNLLLISNGRVSVSDADCRDKLCIRQRSINKNGESIICLPHKLVVQVKSKEESELDAVTY